MEKGITQIDLDNLEFQQALQIIQYTRRSLFLTGKAGTGKSTFLRYICQNTKKKHVVLAPTGIAAINAGGSTLHSFFKLPFHPLLPNDTRYNRRNIRETLKYNGEKRKILRELELAQAVQPVFPPLCRIGIHGIAPCTHFRYDEAAGFCRLRVSVDVRGVRFPVQREHDGAEARFFVQIGQFLGRAVRKSGRDSESHDDSSFVSVEIASFRLDYSIFGGESQFRTEPCSAYRSFFHESVAFRSPAWYNAGEDRDHQSDDPTGWQSP